MYKSKNIVILLLLFAGLISTTKIEAQWYSEKCPTKNNLNGISYIDINSGWIVGERGTILYRSGDEWKKYKEFTSENLNSVFMTDKNNMWSVGDNGTIIHFNGKNWESYDSPTTYDLFSVSFKDSENGIAVGDFGTILIFKNGGWNLLESGIRGNLYSVFYKKDEAWIGGGLECINVPIIKMGLYKNENSFINSFDPYATIKSIAFCSYEDGWAVGSPSTLLHFDGNQWQRTSTNDDYPSLNSVFFSEENDGISVGYGGTVLIYSDNVWTKEKTMTSQNLNGAVITKNKYFAVGDSGTIISRDLGSDKVIYDPFDTNPKIIQVYPNPCDAFLNVVIPFEDDNLTISITVSNITGEIIMQKELRFSTISLTYTLVTSDLKDGLYFIKTAIEGITTTNKFIVRH